MAYYLSFFCRSGEKSARSALARFVAELSGSGRRPVLVMPGAGEYVDEVAVCKLATDDGSGTPAAGWIGLELYAGVEFIADNVIAASPDDAHGIWGSDLQVQLTLSGETDQALVERVWLTLVDMWSAVAWDEMSGFEINRDRPSHG